MTTKGEAEAFFSDLERESNDGKFFESIQTAAIDTIFAALCDVNPESRLDLSSEESWSQYRDIIAEMMAPFTLDGTPYRNSTVNLAMCIEEIKHRKTHFTERDSRTIREEKDPNTLEVRVSILAVLPKGINHLDVDRVNRMKISFTKEDLQSYINDIYAEDLRSQFDSERLFDNFQDAIEKIDDRSEDMKKYIN